MLRRNPLGRLAVVLVASTVVLAGCSNDKGSSTTSASTNTPTSSGTSATAGPFDSLKHMDAPNPCKLDPGVTATEIKVGGIAPETGAQAVSFQPAEDGGKAR